MTRPRPRAIRSVAVLLAVGCGYAWGQTPEDVSWARPLKAAFKFKAPGAKGVLRVRPRAPVQGRLQNGLTLLILEDHRFPVVRLELQIAGAGTLLESVNRCGLAELTAEMLLEGTETRSSRQLAEEIDRYGVSAISMAPPGRPNTVLQMSGLAQDFAHWLGLFAEIALRPAFAETELAKLKQRREAQLRRQAGSPSFLAAEQFRRAVFGDHPAGGALATVESLALCTVDDLKQWHRERYVPQNAVLGVSGDIDPVKAMSAVRKVFGGWLRTDFSFTLPAPPHRPPEARAYLVDRPNSVQVTIWAGSLGPSRLSEDYLPMVALNRVLGGGPSSRLYMRIREEKGIAYSVGSSYAAHAHPGAWRVYADVPVESAGDALAALLAEISRLRQEETPAEELQETKRALTAQSAFSLEQPANALSSALTCSLLGLAADEPARYVERVQSVTAEDVRRVAGEYLDMEHLQVIVVADAGRTRPALERFGPIQEIRAPK